MEYLEINVLSKLRNLLKNWVFWVFIVTIIAIIIRSIPAWTNYGWGADLGIFVGITRRYIASGEFFHPYYGWGSSYNYFPVLYAITGFVSTITGLDVLVVMPKIGPIFGGLTVLLFFFVVKELTGNRKIALLSSMIFAVLPFHVYQTSHTYPLTVGHFFMMFSILLFLKYRRNIWFIFPLLISTVLLIMSHHLSTYFYLISLIIIVFVENSVKREWTEHLKKDIFYILTSSVLIFSYWAFIAVPVYRGFMNNNIQIGALELGNNATIFLFYILFAVCFLLIWLKKRLNIFIEKKEPTFKQSFKLFLIVSLVWIFIMISSVFVVLPDVYNTLPVKIIFLSIPLMVIFSFAGAGFKSTYFIKNGAFIRGWFFAIIFSLFFSVLFDIRPLFPSRHFEYLDAPLAIIAAFGINYILINYDFSKFFSKIKSSLNIKPVYKSIKVSVKRSSFNKNIVYFFFIILILGGNAFSVYAIHEGLGRSQEHISKNIFSTIDEWMFENLDKNNSVVVSGHRIERVAESAGFNTTQNKNYDIWAAQDIDGCILELYGVNKSYGRTTHIIIDNVMVEKKVHVGFGKEGIVDVIMTEDAYNKFKTPFFNLIYRNESIDFNLETGQPIEWVEVYEVNWNYIKEYLGSKK